MPWLILSQALPDALAATLSELLVLAFLLFSEQLGRLDVRWAFVVWVVEEGNGTEEDGLWGLDGAPPLRGVLISKDVLAGSMQNRYAQLAVLVYVGMEGNGCLERECRWGVRVGFWEAHDGSKESA